APNVAMVSTVPHAPTGGETPVVIGLAEGTAIITATHQSLSGSMTVTVRDRARRAWSTPVGTGSVDAGVAIGADGTIYVGTNDFGAGSSRWSAVSPQGGELWSLSLPRTWYSTPAIGPDGTLYL